jgi:NADH dehydrogenase [ubiquinone] 1 alpha subcomplex assembly factor 6
LNDLPFASVAQLETHAEYTMSSLLYLSLESFQVREITTDHIASHLGKAIGIITLIRSIPFHAHLRRVYIPSELISQVRQRPSPTNSSSSYPINIMDVSLLSII